MRWNAIVLIWMCAASAAWTGCGAASSQARYSMSPASTGAASAPMAEQTTVATGSSDEAPSAPQPPAPEEPQPASQPSARESTAGPQQAPQRNVPGVARTGPASNTGNGTTPAQPATQAPATPAPMLIYTADIDLQTAREQVTPTIDRLIEAATSMGGYLLRRTDTSVQVRVPSVRFRESLRRVEDMGEVLHRTVNAQDVSEEFNDLEVRLQNLRAVRHRLEEFLARAGSMADALSVERELERITREIDTIEGRLRFLSTRVAFSLVTVNVHARPENAVAAGPAMPPRRAVNLPVIWFQRVGLERLLNTTE